MGGREGTVKYNTVSMHDQENRIRVVFFFFFSWLEGELKLKDPV